MPEFAPVDSTGAGLPDPGVVSVFDALLEPRDPTAEFNPGAARSDVTRILIVEDNWIWASAVRDRIEKSGGFRIVGFATNVEDGAALLEQKRPDVALVDLWLRGVDGRADEDGLRLARLAKARDLATKVVMYTVDPTEWARDEARTAGAAGFVCKGDIASGEALIQLLRRVERGAEVYDALECDHGNGLRQAAPYDLSASDVQLIACFRDGLSTSETSERMCLSSQTIRNRTTAIGKKLAVSGRNRIVAKALAEGIIELPSAV